MGFAKWFGRKKSDDDEPVAGEPSANSPVAEPVADGASPRAAAAEPAPKKRSAFDILKRGLAKTSKALKNIFSFGRKLDAEALEQIETTLIQADFGPQTALALTEELRDAYKDREFQQDELTNFLKERLVARLGEPRPIQWAATGPTIMLVAGVNGTGKTTSIAKLARRFTDDGKKVILAAGDTFRAAAVEQLAIWSDRIGVEMIKGTSEEDPAAVVFRALDALEARGADVLIIDTAGRLHTEKNLMAQLAKITRVIQKRYPDAPHEVIQVLDATTGQNAITQAQEFKRVINVTGLILSKMDGTARGGVIIPILQAVGVPVKYIGVGEGLDHLQPFDPRSFVDALFEDLDSNDA
ncbi:MAG: signal recognition particle-docking protein FtsY [Planctomycetota bacterium]